MNNYLNAFIKISLSNASTANESDETKLQEKLAKSQEETSKDPVVGEEEEKNEDSSNPPDLNKNESDERKVYLITQIQNLLNDLTNKTSNTLKQTSPASNDSSTTNSSNLNAGNGALAAKLNNQPANINAKSVADFRTHTILCSNCYGDLFIV
jgi:hypothetical protein